MRLFNKILFVFITLTFVSTTWAIEGFGPAEDRKVRLVNQLLEIVQAKASPEAYLAFETQMRKAWDDGNFEKGILKPTILSYLDARGSHQINLTDKLADTLMEYDAKLFHLLKVSTGSAVDIGRGQFIDVDCWGECMDAYRSKMTEDVEAGAVIGGYLGGAQGAVGGGVIGATVGAARASINCSECVGRESREEDQKRQENWERQRQQTIEHAKRLRENYERNRYMYDRSGAAGSVSSQSGKVDQFGSIYRFRQDPRSMPAQPGKPLQENYQDVDVPASDRKAERYSYHEFGHDPERFQPSQQEKPVYDNTRPWVDKPSKVFPERVDRNHYDSTRPWVDKPSKVFDAD